MFLGPRLWADSKTTDSQGTDGQAHLTKYCKHIRMRLECVEPLDLDSHEAMLHGELSDCCNALDALPGNLVEMPANGSTLDALAGDFWKTGGSLYQSLANVVAQTETWKACVDLWIKNRDVVTTLATQLKRLTTQLAERTFDSEGQNCQDMCTLMGEAVQFLTDNVSNAPQELISNFQTLLEDQAQKFIVFQLKTVEAAIGFRAEGDHGHAAQAEVDLGWISKLVLETLLAFSVAAWVIDMQELVAALQKRIHSAIFSSELWTNLGSATTQFANGKHSNDAE